MAENAELKRQLIDEKALRSQINTDVNHRFKLLEEELNTLKSRLAVGGGGGGSGAVVSLKPIHSTTHHKAITPPGSASIHGPIGMHRDKARAMSESDSLLFYDSNGQRIKGPANDPLSAPNTILTTGLKGSSTAHTFGSFALPPSSLKPHITATVGGGSNSGGAGVAAKPPTHHNNPLSSSSSLSSATSAVAPLTATAIQSFLRSMIPQQTVNTVSVTAASPQANSALAILPATVIKQILTHLWNEMMSFQSSLSNALAHTSKLSDFTVVSRAFGTSSSSAAETDASVARYYRLKFSPPASSKTSPEKPSSTSPSAVLPPSIDLLLRTDPNCKVDSDASVREAIRSEITLTAATPTTPVYPPHPHISHLLHHFIEHSSPVSSLSLLSLYYPFTMSHLMVHRFVSTNQPFSAREVVFIGLQLCSAVLYLADYHLPAPTPAITPNHILISQHSSATSSLDGGTTEGLSSLDVITANTHVSLSTTALPPPPPSSSAQLFAPSIYTAPTTTTDKSRTPTSQHKAIGWSIGVLLYQLIAAPGQPSPFLNPSRSPPSASLSGPSASSSSMSVRFTVDPRQFGDAYYAPPIISSVGGGVATAKLEQCLQFVLRGLLRVNAMERLSISDARLAFEKAYFNTLIGGGGTVSPSPTIVSPVSSARSTPSPQHRLSHLTNDGSGAGGGKDGLSPFMRLQNDVIIRTASYLTNRSSDTKQPPHQSPKLKSVSATATTMMSPNVEDLLILDSLLSGRITAQWFNAAANSNSSHSGNNTSPPISALTSPIAAALFGPPASTATSVSAPPSVSGGGGGSATILNSFQPKPSASFVAHPFLASLSGGGGGGGSNAGGGAVVTPISILHNQTPSPLPSTMVVISPVAKPPPPVVPLASAVTASTAAATGGVSPTHQTAIESSIASLLSDSTAVSTDE